MTNAEARLWLHLRADQIEGVSFRRQHPVGPYVLDFYAPSLKLAVEIDGSQHLEPALDAEWAGEAGSRRGRRAG